MQNNDLEILQCVDCNGELKLKHSEIVGGVIINGLLKCLSCERSYPVIDEVGVFFKKEYFNYFITEWEIEKIKKLGYWEILKNLNSNKKDKCTDKVKRQVKVAKNWEYQHENVYNWEQDIATERFHGKKLFWKFIPIEPASVKGKTVYAACVGRGKEAYHVLQEGPYKVIANEIGAEVYTITNILKKRRKDLIVLRYDITYPPLKPQMADIAICDHALQHVSDHKLAFKKLVENLKENGTISICVYSYENNFLMTHLIEPIKHILNHFPLWFVRGLAFLPALIIYLMINFIYLPFSKICPNLAEFLPLYKHMIFWSTSSLKLVWCSCFDLMHAPISYHFRKEEVDSLAASNGLEIVSLKNTHGTTWSLVAKKSGKI